MHKIAIVFITTKPLNDWLHFINNLSKPNYNIYVSIDNDDYVVSNNYKNIHYINYSQKECEQKGFNHALAPFHVDRPSGWDKAIYHFCVKDTSYDYVWFVEDDVFVPTIDTISNIDKKYPKSDLLCTGDNNNQESFCTVFDIETKQQTKWWYHLAFGKIQLPWATSMVCACRLSKKLLTLINKYVKEHNTLLYHEFMFTTIALHNKLIVNYPEELKILWRYNWTFEEMNVNNLYHPVKSISRQLEFRNKLINHS